MNDLRYSKPFFNSLQVFRGIAALMVVFHHEWAAFAHFFHVENEIFGFLAALGKYGVDFFFVLSGFIITYSNYEKAGRISGTKTYIVNRVLRIYLPFLPMSVLMLLLYYLFPTVSEGQERDISLITSLTLVPAGKPALTVAWTLVHEMMFYLLFLSWFFSKRIWYGIVIAWTIIIIYLNYLSPGFNWSSSAFLHYFGSFYNLEFILGFLSALLIKQRGVQNKFVFGTSGLLVMVCFIVLKWVTREETSSYSGMNLILAFGLALIMIGSIGTKIDKVSSKSILMILGNASYSIYLVHNPAISVLMRSFLKLPDFVPPLIIFIVIFLLCCIVGVFYSKIFEEYFLKLFKKKLLPVREVKSKTEIILSSGE